MMTSGMEPSTQVAVLTALGVIFAAIITHFLSRLREHRLQSLQFKLDRYTGFFESFAELGSGPKTHLAHVKLANAINKMNLIASREVLVHVYELLSYIRNSYEPSYSFEE